MSRPFDIRVREYRDSLRSQADQLEEVGRLAGKPEVVADPCRLFRLIADDLSVMLDGGELRGFLITGEIPVPRAEDG
jgi:hypothetical protein